MIIDVHALLIKLLITEEDRSGKQHVFAVHIATSGCIRGNSTLIGKATMLSPKHNSFIAV